MPPFFASIGASLAANAIKLALVAMAAAALLGGGYVWGSTHATRIAMEASAGAAQAQVAAVSASYQATITDYAGKLKAQQIAADKLTTELDQARTQLAAAGAVAKEKISHVVPKNVVCDLPAVALDVLRSQPARH